MRTLRARMAVNTAKFLGVVTVVLLLSAGTWRYWQAWLFVGLNLVWLRGVGHWLLARDPALVERRMTQDEQGEKERVQRIVMTVMRVLGLATLVVAGVDRRLGASHVPLVGVLAGCALFAAGAGVVAAVFAANTFASSIIEVAPSQAVVASGPYRFVRHPMYSGTVLMGLGTPLVLGSYWAALLVPAGWALLVVRILAEERFLARHLAGYEEYAARTRRRLVPGVW